MKMDLGISAWEQFTFRIEDIHFGKQRPRVHANGVAGARYFAGKLTIRKRSNVHGGGHARSNSIAVHLRHIYENTHRADIGYAEKLCAHATVAGVDEVTHLCPPSGYHSVEGRIDLLEALHLLESAHFRGGGLHVCGLRVEVLVVVIDFLLRN